MEAASDKTRVLLGVTGGIAAYKAAELASRLCQQGCEVRVVMSDHAKRFVGPLTFAALTGNPVPGDWFEANQESTISHIDLARWAQVVVVAPATANFLAKAAHGLADDLLSTLLLATDAPLLLAPAMNPHMYGHPTVRDNLAALRGRGVQVVGPAAGRTACGEDGPGRMVEPMVIAERALDLLSDQDLAGVPLLVTAGPTREHLDPVRYLSNPSSGRMGIEVARAARRRGAVVTLVLGPTHLEPPEGVETVRVTSAEEMAEAVNSRAKAQRVIIKAAAVSDFRPQDCAPQKVKKGEALEVCNLVGTPDILAGLGADKGDTILVGFAAETDRVLAHAGAKLKAKNLDLMVANDVAASDSGFAVETNRVQLLTPDGEVEALPLMSKQEVAHRLLDRVARLLGAGD
ncbi:MAG: bifunctional phosphopantothenoylcysteine decarboxylase/phosphopantothenate--cysteine ligase CoaBC [Desulfarculaceae bacterium]|nr:bifunctional phosphopantothenoylcysteine decarboxylase/phosphopantothenate--cysteine ligase CoaBC [Desulfarculaceae bacterium]MCF8072075.1 bifunctional phosphopantothenoylcysteine decarboxylase/phosphopantothenate--cysteine ligase CoaBC [Desulfarculaceae bacterium]MCF8101592.1 bifunctional phosphopantothenoylcysteine decarboxylase/phosphopantothenate--cysteine ligase CoaBC [Desulfarculaceae bacterium]MCF8115142.1 bifunctional phosphopantothenoylcysteine decarboxylase/phosphopantothenate--cyst